MNYSRGPTGPCMCGAPDCPSCGPAQGYSVVRVWNPKRHRYEWVNPPEDEEEKTTTDDEGEHA